jgi:hypothetical protein
MAILFAPFTFERVTLSVPGVVSPPTSATLEAEFLGPVPGEGQGTLQHRHSPTHMSLDPGGSLPLTCTVVLPVPGRTSCARTGPFPLEEMRLSPSLSTPGSQRRQGKTN